MAGTQAGVAVLGTGTMGAMTLWRLARRGIPAVGIEQFAPGHDQSAAGGETRIFRTAYLEGPQYVPLLQESQSLWRELEAEAGRSLLTLTGGLMIGSPGSPGIGNVLDSIRAFDLPHEILEPAAARSRYPQHQIGNDEIMVLDKQAGFLRPELAVLMAAAAAERAGAAVERYRRIEAIEPGAGGVSVHADGTERRFDQVVVAGGAWAGRLVPRLAPWIQPRRIVLAWFAARQPELFTPERCPIFIRTGDADGSGHMSGMPSVDGAGVKISGDSVHDLVPDPDSLDRTVSVADLARTREAVERLMPGLYPYPIRVSAYMDGYTPDGHALVGVLPGTDRVIVLAGFSGHGFKMSPVIGDIAADLLCDGKTSRPVDHLAPGRFS
jgi:sarcosine oxidase